MKRALALLFLFVLAISVSLAAEKQPITDGWLMDQVRLRLANNPDVRVSDIKVQVVERVVTLTGRVDRASQRSLAEKIAREVR